MRNKKIRQFSFIIISLLFIFKFCQSADAKFINLWLSRVGGKNLVNEDAANLAKFDIIVLQKIHYNDIGGDSYGAIKAINPNIKIYLYAQTVTLGPGQDSFSTLNLTSFGRYDISRGHSMGSFNRDHPELFLLNSSGERVQWTYHTATRYWLDFGNSDLYDYAIEAITTDYVGRTWTADGIFNDYIWAVQTGATSTPAKYDTDAKWSTAMNSMANAMTVGLAAQGQKYGCNRGGTRWARGVNAWLALDASTNPPDIVQDEIGFATGDGPGDIQQIPELDWVRQIDILSAIKNSKVFYQSDTDILPDTSGTDYYGKSFTFWDGLWYCLGSYLIGKNEVDNNSYFSYGNASLNLSNKYYDEYDKIDLGRAVSGYNVTVYSGNNIYWREFEKGYVYVNPTINDVTSISLPELCKQRTHDNLGRDMSSLQNIDTIDLKSHRAAILYKSNNLALFTAPNNLRVIFK